MKVIVFGASGMLGHKVYQVLKAADYEVLGTIRDTLEAPRYRRYDFFDRDDIITNVDAQNYGTIEELLKDLQPDVVINCLGIIKPLAKDPIETIRINSLFPNRLAKSLIEQGGKLIHISTDCVFSGNEGNYSEESNPDPVDLYGRSKLLGEVVEDTALTIRTSIIGREIGRKMSLVEWILSQKKEINGFSRAIFSGLYTGTLAKIIIEIIKKSELTGLLQIASAPIDKYKLLNIFNDVYGLNLIVNKHDDFFCDRSLNADKMKSIGLTVPSMDDMVRAMFEDNRLYENDS